MTPDQSPVNKALELLQTLADKVGRTTAELWPEMVRAHKIRALGDFAAAVLLALIGGMLVGLAYSQPWMMYTGGIVDPTRWMWLGIGSLFLLFVGVVAVVATLPQALTVLSAATGDLAKHLLERK